MILLSTKIVNAKIKINIFICISYAGMNKDDIMQIIIATIENIFLDPIFSSNISLVFWMFMHPSLMIVRSIPFN